MVALLIAVFLIGYFFIAVEHSIRVNKTASALITGVLCWIIYILFNQHFISISDLPSAFTDTVKAHGLQFSDSAKLLTYYTAHYQLLNRFAEIGNILFFLLGAMTIVEIIDTYDGFAVITDKLKAVKQVHILWIVGMITFFLSATLDNLTTTIVMISVLRKLIDGRENRLFFTGIVVIAANAGGAWTPIGDVTTTMLWIGGQITAVHIMKVLFLPSLVCLLAPLIYLSVFKMKGNVGRPAFVASEKITVSIDPFHQRLILFMGIGGLILVPVLKATIDLTAFMGMMFSLSILWITSELISRKHNNIEHTTTHITKALKRVDTPSILFFLGILMAVAALQSAGLLSSLAAHLDQWIGNQTIIVLVIGLLSSIIDNVPLVAAGMGMYNLPTDSFFWEFLAYCAGTGGSCLIIGSAAGVAAMGLEKIDFMWYMKKMSILALLGYFAGAIVYILTNSFFMSH